MPVYMLWKIAMTMQERTLLGENVYQNGASATDFKRLWNCALPSKELKNTITKFEEIGSLAVPSRRGKSVVT